MFFWGKSGIHRLHIRNFRSHARNLAVLVVVNCDLLLRRVVKVKCVSKVGKTVTIATQGVGFETDLTVWLVVF